MEWHLLPFGKFWLSDLGKSSCEKTSDHTTSESSSIAVCFFLEHLKYVHESFPLTLVLSIVSQRDRKGRRLVEVVDFYA